MDSPKDRAHFWTGCLQVLVFGSVLSTIMAPQFEYIESRREYLPASFLVGLNLLYAALVGLLLLRVIKGITHLPANRPLILATVVSSLPMYSLWLPWMSVNSSRPFFVTATTVGAVLVAVVVLLAHLPSPEDFETGGVLVFVVATMSGLVMSRVIAQVAVAPDLYLSASVAWGLYLLASLVGWGSMVNHWLFRDQQIDWGQRAAWGLAFTVAVGGFLNLTWIISQPVVLFFLALGFAAFISNLKTVNRQYREAAQRWFGDPITVVLIILVVTLVAVQFVGSVAGTVKPGPDGPAFDRHDDNQAYLVFPKKMLDLGSMGPEPFEPRRMLSLGGQSFLQTLVLVTLPMRALHLIDGGVALLILIGMVWGARHRFGLDQRSTIFLMLLVLAFPHTLMRESTSSLLTGVVLLVSWYRLYADGLDEGGMRWKFPTMTALTASSLWAIKSIFIPVAVVFFVASTAAHIASSRERRDPVLDALVACGVGALLIMPWMISSFESSGTLLYPVLGQGFYGGVYSDGFASIAGSFEVPFHVYLQAIWKHLLRLLLVVLLLVIVRDTTPRRPSFSLAVAVVFGVIALVVFGDPNLDRALIRFGFGLSMAAFLGLSLEAFRSSPLASSSNRSPTIAKAGAFAIGALFLLHSQDAIRGMYYDILRNAAAATQRPSLVSLSDLNAITGIEAAIPPGERVLTTISHPYLLDMTRQQVFIMSLPGMSSLPPGLPLDEGGEAVAEYLTGRGIHYLAYSGMGDIKDLLELTADDIQARYPASKTRWVMLRCHERYQAAVRELAATRTQLYFDGQTVVLDLLGQETMSRENSQPGGTS